MGPIDKTKREARRIVAARLRAFFAALKEQVAATEDFWKRVESRMTRQDGESRLMQQDQDQPNR